MYELRRACLIWRDLRDKHASVALRHLIERLQYHLLAKVGVRSGPETPCRQGAKRLDIAGIEAHCGASGRATKRDVEERSRRRETHHVPGVAVLEIGIGGKRVRQPVTMSHFVADEAEFA